MPSETSFFDFTLFKKNVSRYWPLWAGYLVIWLFALPISLLMSSATRLPFYLINDIANLAEVNPWFAFFFGVVSAMAVLSFLYSPRSANFFGSLPVRREGIFLTQYISGLSFAVIPDLIVAGATLLAAASRGVNAGSAVLVWLGTACGCMFFFYTFAFLCGMFAGHLLALPAFYAIFNFIFISAYELAESVLGSLYYGFYSFGDKSKNVVEWLTPMTKLSHVYWRYDQELGAVVGSRTYGGWLPVAVYCAVAVAMLAASFFLYRSRRLESAGDVVALRPMRPVFKYIVAAGVGTFLGYVTSNILGEATLPYMAVLWTVVGCFAAQMILEKSFRVWGKWRGAAAAGALMAVLMACLALDVTGYEKWLPDPEKVDSVYIESVYTTGTNVGDSADLANVTVTDPGVIRDIVDIHREAIEKRGDIESRELYTGPEDDRDGESCLLFVVTYNMGSSRHTRHYYLYVNESDASRPGTAAHALMDIYNNRDFLWKCYGFDKLEEYLSAGGRIGELWYDYRDYYGADDDPELDYAHFKNGGGLAISNYANVMELYEAIKLDFAQGNIGTRSIAGDSGRSRRMELAYGGSGQAYRGDVYYDDAEIRYSDSIRLVIGENAKNTLKVLFRVLPEELENQGLLEKTQG